MVSYFKCCHSTKYGKVPFTLVKGFHANNNENVCAIYMTYNASALLKFITIDGISVNLRHNYSKSDCQKLQKFKKFQETSTLHMMFQSMLL